MNENPASANLERARAGEPFISPPRVPRGLLSGPLLSSRDADNSSKSSKETEPTEDPKGSEESEVAGNSGDKKKKRKHKTLKRANQTSEEAQESAKAAREVAQAANNSVDEVGAKATNLGSRNSSQSGTQSSPRIRGEKSPDSGEDGEADDSEEGENDSVDTQTLLLKELGIEGRKRFENSSDSESDSDDSTDSRARLYKGLFKFTPQEVYGGLKGDEDPIKKGWSRKFLSTKIQTETGEMSFLQALANKRHALRWRAVRDSVNRGGENSYVPTLHITQNQGFNASMLTELSHKAFRKLQNEFSTAEAVTPGQVDFAALIPKTMHTQLCIELRAYCMVHRPGEEPWLNTMGDGWKTWKPSTFFERVLRVYPPPGVARESALLTQLLKQPLNYSDRDNYVSVTEWFKGMNNILESYDDRSIDQDKVLKSIIRKLRSQGQGAYTITNRLVEQDPQNFKELWMAWETQRRVIGSANLLVKEVAPGDYSKDRPDPYKEKDLKNETGAERRRRLDINRRAVQSRCASTATATAGTGVTSHPITAKCADGNTGALVALPSIQMQTILTRIGLTLKRESAGRQRVRTYSPPKDFSMGTRGLTRIPRSSLTIRRKVGANIKVSRRGRKPNMITCLQYSM